MGLRGMGKGRKKKEPVSGTKKELVIITRPAITIDQVKSDERKKQLLLILKALDEQGGIYERSLAYLLYWLKSEKNIDLGYNFHLVGDVPTSKQLHDDVVALLYTGLIETDAKTKKLRVTNTGREFISSIGYDEEFFEKLKSLVEEYRPKISAIDAQIELTTMLMRPGSPRRRRI